MATTEHSEQIPVKEQLEIQEPNVNGEEKVTVFSDPINFNVKHPLHNSWTLWYDNPNKKNSHTNWLDNVKELITFDSVEDFWGVYNNVVKASELPQNSNYHLFKAGVKPMWEDPANEKGGKWVAQFPRRSDIDKLWMHMLLACVGENFEYEDEICGVVMGVRKSFYRVSLWTRTASEKGMSESIGRRFKNILEIPNLIEFTSHEAAAKDSKGPLYTA